jgi:hypothetical protein
LLPQPFSWINHLIRPQQQRRRDGEAEGHRFMQNMRAAQIEGVFARGTRHARNWMPHAYLHIIQRYTGRRSGIALRYWILASRTR